MGGSGGYSGYGSINSRPPLASSVNGAQASQREIEINEFLEALLKEINTCEASHNETAAPIFDRGGGFALMPRADVLVIRQVIIGAPSLISSKKFQILSLVPFQVDSNPL